MEVELPGQRSVDDRETVVGDAEGLRIGVERRAEHAVEPFGHMRPLAPTHVSMRLVGKSGLCGPNSTVSIMKLLQKKATSPMTPIAITPRTRCGRRASMCSKKVISVDSGSFFFMFICLPPRNRCDYSVFPESDLSPGLLSSAV